LLRLLRPVRLAAMHHHRAGSLVALSLCWGTVVLYAGRAGPLWAGTPRPTVLIAADAPPDPPNAGVVATHALADLTVPDAIRLDGQQVRLRLIDTSGQGLVEGARVFEAGFGFRDDLATVWLLASDDGPADAFAVGATVKVMWHKATLCAGRQLFPGFLEVRLLDAERVESK
jgi:hypothetical protein